MSEQSASPIDELPEQLVITDAETLKAMGDALRMRIHWELEEPMTVKELAARLGVPQTRLYYHVKILERAGLIRVVARRTVSGIEERTYHVSARSTVVSPDIAGELLAESGALKALLDMVAAELEVALHNPGPFGTPESSVIALTQTRVLLAPDSVAEFQQRLYDLVSEYNEDPEDAEKTEYSMFFEVHRKDRGRVAP
jgi:DNA-binding transcriptional ArsR family regulator